MQNIINFNFQNNQKVRTFLKNDEIFFNLKDICNILEINNPSQVLPRLNPKGVIRNDTLTKGGNQLMSYINESNVYKVIFKSNKPEAIKFEDWVTSEVLPSIRKTGSYSVGSNDVNVNNNNEISIKIKDLQQISSSLKLHKQNNENLLNDIERLKLNIAQLNNTISYIKQERTDALVFGKTILATLHEYEEKYNINLII